MFDKIIKQENYNFELVDNFWQVKDRAGNLITQLINNDSIENCLFKYYDNNTFIAFELQHDMFARKYRLINNDGKIISPDKPYDSMKPILNTNAILCMYAVPNTKAYNGWLELYDIINKQGKILYENLIVIQMRGPEKYQDFDNYEELPLYYLDTTEDNIKKSMDASWKDEDLNMIDEKFLKGVEGIENV